VLAGGLVVGLLAKQCSVVGSVIDGRGASLPPTGRQIAGRDVVADLVRGRWRAELIRIVGSVGEGSRALLPPSGRHTAACTVVADLVGRGGALS
jgi:hypothetical protein